MLLGPQSFLFFLCHLAIPETHWLSHCYAAGCAGHDGERSLHRLLLLQGEDPGSSQELSKAVSQSWNIKICLPLHPKGEKCQLQIHPSRTMV